MKNILNNIRMYLKKKLHLFSVITHFKKTFCFFDKYFKKRRQTNNPQLTKLMESKMTFKQLKQREKQLKEKRLNLIAQQSSIRYSKILYNREIDNEEYDKISDEIYQIDDLLQGIKTKIREVGFEYEYIIEKSLPKSDGGQEIWIDRKTIILEKQYPDNLSGNDLIEFMTSININVGESVKKIRRIIKNQ